MFKGAVYCRKWEHEGKNRKAWGIRYSVNGGAIIRKIVADTKGAAQTELDKLREDHKNRLLGVSEGKTLADLLPLFLAHKGNQGTEIKTIQSRLNNLLPFFGAFPLEDIDAAAIDRYIQSRRAGGVVNATINRDVSVLRNMLRMAVRKWKWLRQEPYIEKLPESGPRDFELTEAEEAAVLPACSPELTAIIGAAIHTGMRQGELLSLTWGQVDLASRTLDFEPTKRGRKRLVPIAEPLYYTLMRFKAARGASGGPKPTDRVFLRPDGLPWTQWTLTAHYHKALGAAEITTPLTWHDLRHTTASRLKRGGVHKTEIQRLLGHKTLAMTDRYINVEVEQLRAAVAVLSKPSTKEAQERDASEGVPGNSLN